MDNYSYASYPDSCESSAPSSAVDFENPPPWEELRPSSYKIKFMCSYGGKIYPRPHDKQLSYVGGETKILAFDRRSNFSTMIKKLEALSGDSLVCFKYQLPGKDLDDLISITNDDDLEDMMHEYDRLHRVSTTPVRMRLFLFPVNPSPFTSFGLDGGIPDLISFPVNPSPFTSFGLDGGIPDLISFL